MQNQLRSLLIRKYGEAAVGYEDDSFGAQVDLTLRAGEQTTFFEVKHLPTAKLCIREALGQLLEYSCYPSQCAAKELIVVGAAPCLDDDLKYLTHLKETYNLAIGYWQFDLESSAVLQREGVQGPEC